MSRCSVNATVQNTSLSRESHWGMLARFHNGGTAFCETRALLYTHCQSILNVVLLVSLLAVVLGTHIIEKSQRSYFDKLAEGTLIQGIWVDVVSLSTDLT